MTGTFLRDAAGLQPGEHACLVYDDDRRRDDAVLAFLLQGLDRRERVVYLARAPHDPVALALRTHGADGQVQVLESVDCYLTDGDFDPDRALAGFEAALAEAAASGYEVVRSAGGPPPAVTDNGRSRELPAYERRARSLFDGRRLVSLCSYDARRVPPVSLLGIIEAHPVVLYALGGDGRLAVRSDGAELAAAGWLDATTLGVLVAPLGAAVHLGVDVSVDLGDVDFVDVSGLRLLADAARELHARGRRLLVSHAPAPVPTMLSLLGLSETEGLVLS